MQKLIGKKAKLLKGSPVDKKHEEPKEEHQNRLEDKLVIDRHGNIIHEPAERTAAPRTAAQRTEGAVKRKPGSSGKQGKNNEDEVLTDRELMLKEDEKIPEDFRMLKQVLQEKVGLGKSFDVVFREMVFGGQNTGIFYYNGFAKDTVLTDILMRLSYADSTRGRQGQEQPGRHAEGTGQHGEAAGKHGAPGTYHQERDGGQQNPGREHGGQHGTAQGHKGEKAQQRVISLFDEALIPHIQVSRSSKLKEIVDTVAAGGTAFFFEGVTEAVLVDAKSFPVRSIDEPDLEKVVRGARDGFVETLMTNVTLVRRRIRDPRLKLELTKVGVRTNTDVCIAYIQDICDMDLVEAVRKKIKSVKVDGIPLAEKQLEEAVIGKGWNPYPLVRYSERPDVVAAHLLEGHIIVLVDTSPSVMILPTTFFHHVQHAEEYRQTPIIGTYLRWVRFAGIISSLFLLPVWFLIVTSPELKPFGLEFIGPQEQGKIPLLGQFLIAELGIDLMRMAAIHTPSPLTTAMGLVAAILIGDVAVKTGLFVNEVILYLAAAAVGNFATPSYELGLANRLVRLGLLLAAAFFKVPGLIIGCTIFIVTLVLQRSYNTPYMWPFIPFNAKAMLDILLRRPFTSAKKRMSLNKTFDRTRQPQS